jgi:hypothetical protein
MSKVLVRYRNLALAVTLLAVAGCRDGTGPGRLTPQDVGGAYHICALTFTPAQPLLPPAFIRGAAIDTTADAARAPRLFLDNQSNNYRFEYSAPGSTLPRDVLGFYTTGTRTVAVQFPAADADLSRPDVLRLLPQNFELEFQEGPRRLNAHTENHLMPRADYVRVAGLESGEGLDQQIRGTITGHFQVGGC